LGDVLVAARSVARDALTAPRRFRAMSPLFKRILRVKPSVVGQRDAAFAASLSSRARAAGGFGWCGRQYVR